MIVQIIDDDRINLKILEAMTRRVPNTTPYCFSSPLEALKWNQDNEPDLILVDYIMPHINGIEFIQKVKSLKGISEVPIIMITGESEKSIRYRALEIGVNDFLNKPVDSTEFIARLRNMLIIRQNQKELSKRADWLATEVKKATREIELREMETIYCLSRATELRDPETGEHILRMTYYSHHILRNLGLEEFQQELILKIAPMHDIGKVGITDSILLKPGKLTDEEFSIMTTHTTIGYNILKDSTSKVLQEASIIALNHHEKYDGTGYPNKLKGEEINLFSRVVAVADVFDALTSVRPYKKAWKVEDALSYITNSSGTHFDPQCVEAFLKNWDNVLKIKKLYSDK
ncbi:MAG TPA: response regulator [Nitrospirae bacterium]|nr:response regulator [Nitrospirota bacterium]